jgi:autotransporter-associated beta strand protein
VSGGTSGSTQFNNTSTAGSGTFVVNGSGVSGGGVGVTDFFDTSTAGNGTFTVKAGTVAGAGGGDIIFYNSSTAGNGTFTNNGAALSGTGTGSTNFSDTSSAGGSILIANAGTGSGGGGAIIFLSASTGGTASVKVYGNGFLDISTHNAPGVSVGSIEGSGNVFLGSNTLTTGTNNASTVFSGVIQDGTGFNLGNPGTGGSLAKTGTGMLTLAGANTFTGNTAVTGGLLNLSNGLALQNSTLTTAGIVFDSSVASHAFTIGGLSGSGNIALEDNAETPNPVALSIGNNGANTTYSGTLSGGGSLMKIGAGTLTLTGEGTFTGATTIQSGVLNVGSANPLNTNAPGGAIIFTGGTLRYSAANQQDYSARIQNSTGAISVDTNSQNVTFASALSSTNTGGLMKAGAGTLTMTAANAYTGGTTVNVGTLSYDSTSGGVGAFTINGGTAASNALGGTVQFINTATAGSGTYTDNGTTYVVAGTIANAAAQGGLTEFYNTATAGAGTFIINGGPGSGYGSGFTEFHNSSTAGNGAFINNSGTGGVQSAGGNINFFDTSTAGSGNFTTAGGQVSSQNGGFTQFNNSSTAGNGTFITNGGTVTGAGGGIVRFNDTSTAGFGTFTTNGATVTGASGGNLEFEGTSTAGSATIINNGGSASYIISGFTISVAGGGQTFFDTGTTTGNSTLIANGGTNGGGGGRINLFNGSLGGPARVEVFGNGALDISGHQAAAVPIGSIEGTGNVFLGARSLIVGGNNLNTTFSGVISDAGGFVSGAGGSLTKTGTGSLNLPGANTYTGATTINGGTLFVNGSLANGAVAVNSGGTLGGAGVIGGAVTVNSGGILAPGNSPGTITVGSLTLNSGSFLNYQLGTPGTVGGGVNDLTIVNGNLTLGGAALNITGLSGFGVGTYRLFDYTGTLTGSSLNFGALPSGFSASNFTLQTSVANEINLIVSGTTAALQYWNGPNTTPTAGVLGGTGTWNNATTNWTNATGSANANWQQGTAVFSAGSGTATLGAAISALELQFVPGSGAYTVATGTNTLTLTGAGITNTSGVTQNFIAGGNIVGATVSISFTNGATAGSMTNYTVSGSTTNGLSGGLIQFYNTASAGSGTFVTMDSGANISGEGRIVFQDNATAANGTFTNNGGTVSGAYPGFTEFFGNSTAGSANVTNQGGTASGTGGGLTSFLNSATAGTGTFTTNGGTVSGANGGNVNFNNITSAGSGTFVANGGTAASANGGKINFYDTATAASGTFTMNGPTVAGGGQGSLFFFNSATAGTGTFTANGGTVANGVGGSIEFDSTATAGSGTFTNNGATVFGGFGGSTAFLAASNAGMGTFTNNGSAFSSIFSGGLTEFFSTSTAGGAILIANAGTGGGTGGMILFVNDSTGGTATVKVYGNGNLDLSGHNLPGVAIGSLEGTGLAFLGANNLTVGSNNASTTFSGVISDTGGLTTGTGGSLTKVGTGSLDLTGINTYTGSTNISGGTLFVDGSITSNTIVNSGGTLAGNGTIFGNVTNGGFVSPGHSPGTLSIGGNFTQFASGRLQIAVGGAMAGQYSVLAVGGHASLAGTVQVVRYGAATLKPGDTLKILTAVGGVSGTFSTAVNPFATGALLGMNLIYETSDVLLSFTQNTVTQALASASAFAGVTPNQTAVAGALDKVLADPRAAQVINFLNSQPLANIPGALDRIGPADFTAIFHLVKSLANIQTANVQRRLEDIRGDSASDIAVLGGSNENGGGAQGPNGSRGKTVAPADDERRGLWMVGSGEFTHVGSTANAAGFNLDSGGVTAGVDHRFTEKFAAGISLGYMNTTASLANNGKIDVDGGRIGGYATYFDRGLHLDASVTGGINSYSTRRTAPNNTAATASPEGSEVNLLFAAGYDWKWKGVTLGPTASFQYTNMQLNGFTESGTFAPLSVQAKNADSVRSALGFHATYEAKVGRAILRPEVRAAWQHEFGDTSYSLTSSFATLGGAPFTVSGPATGRDSLLVGAGVSVQWNDRFSIFAYYDGELLRTNYSSNNVSVGFRYRF